MTMTTTATTTNNQPTHQQTTKQTITENAVNLVRQKRPGSIQTAAQESFVYQFERVFTRLLRVFPVLERAGADRSPFLPHGEASLYAKTFKQSVEVVTDIATYCIHQLMQPTLVYQLILQPTAYQLIYSRLLYQSVREDLQAVEVVICRTRVFF